jgi:hypothetical protein
MQIPPHVKQVLKGFGSLRLSVVLLAFSVLLVFFGTLDQVRIGIRDAQDIYFESFFAVWFYPEFWPMGNVLRFIPVPLLGGYLIGPLLLVNLIASHMKHWRPRWSILGISFIHVGIIMLLVGQLVTNLMQQEDYMWLDEGGKSNFVESFREDELYITKLGDGGTLGVYSLPFNDLDSDSTVDLPAFPFQVKVHQLFRNAEIVQGGAVEGREDFGVNKGIAVQFNLVVKEVNSFHSDQQRDIRTAVVEIVHNDHSAGKWLISNVFEERFPQQEFELDGQRYAIGMRYQRTYLPYTITLLKFNHDRYPGTNIPRNFSSQVLVEHSTRNESKEVMIFMNNPLRYEGKTFYQASFAKQDTASMFQVVENPGWLVPYIACILVSLGLVYQFSVAGYRMLRRVK